MNLRDEFVDAYAWQEKCTTEEADVLLRRVEDAHLAASCVSPLVPPAMSEEDTRALRNAVHNVVCCISVLSDMEAVTDGVMRVFTRFRQQGCDTPCVCPCHRRAAAETGDGCLCGPTGDTTFRPGECGDSPVVHNDGEPTGKNGT